MKDLMKRKKKFIRRDSKRYSKLGKNRKKLQKWRGAKGRDNKIREHRRGYPKAPSVGYKNTRKESGKINGKRPEIVYNLSSLEKARKDSIIVIGKVGARKKIDIVKKALEMKFEIVNLAKEKKR